MFATVATGQPSTTDGMAPKLDRYCVAACHGLDRGEGLSRDEIKAGVLRTFTLLEQESCSKISHPMYELREVGASKSEVMKRVCGCLINQFSGSDCLPTKNLACGEVFVRAFF